MIRDHGSTQRRSRRMRRAPASIERRCRCSLQLARQLRPVTPQANGGRRFEGSRAGTTFRLLRAYQSCSPRPNGHPRRLVRRSVRAGHHRVRQPEPVQHRIVHNISRNVARKHDYDVTEFGVSRRRMWHVSAENQPHRHRRSGRTGRRLPQVHQPHRCRMPYERLAFGYRADGHRTGHAAKAYANEHVRRLALHGPASGTNTQARGRRLRGCRSRR